MQRKLPNWHWRSELQIGICLWKEKTGCTDIRNQTPDNHFLKNLGGWLPEYNGNSQKDTSAAAPVFFIMKTVKPLFHLIKFVAIL